MVTAPRSPRDLTVLLPPRLRRTARRLRMLWAMGVPTDPIAFARQWRHRRAFARLQRSLFYHRYATAVLLGHEIGLFDALAAAARSSHDSSELASACGVDPRAAEALARILESEGMVERRGAGWGLSGFGELFLARSGEASVAPMLDLMAAQATAFAELPASMKTGAVPGALDIFSESGRHRAFLGAVNAYLHWAGRDLLGRVSLPPIRSVLVGSMGVSFSAAVLDRFPDARVTYGCLPHLAREIPRLCETYRVPKARIDGVHSHGGEPEQDQWGEPPFDLVFLTKKMILEPEAQLGMRFARKALEVLRPGGVTILWETVHTDHGPTPLPRAMEAVLDLGASPTSPVRTEGELRALLSGLGYEGVEVVDCLEGQTTFVVARKPR